MILLQEAKDFISFKDKGVIYTLQVTGEFQIKEGDWFTEYNILKINGVYKVISVSKDKEAEKIFKKMLNALGTWRSLKEFESNVTVCAI